MVSTVDKTATVINHYIHAYIHTCTCASFCQSISAPKMAVGYETSHLLNLTAYKK
jgi:hypothetical protein